MNNTLTHKQYKQYQKVSRYADFPYYYNVQDDKYVYGTSSRLSLDSPFKVHTIVEGDTLDTLALYYYNNPTYFWVIADYNRINDPYEKLVVGSSIKIPTFSTISFED